MQNRDRGSLPPVARFCVMLQSDWRYFFNRPGAFLLYFPYKNPRRSFFIMHICDRLCVFKAARYTTRLQFRCSMTFISEKHVCFYGKYTYLYIKVNK